MWDLWKYPVNLAPKTNLLETLLKNFLKNRILYESECLKNMLGFILRNQPIFEQEIWSVIYLKQSYFPTSAAALCISVLAQESVDARNLPSFQKGLRNLWKKSISRLLHTKLPLLSWKLLNHELWEDGSVEKL